jgi:hypothetical protein
MLSNDLKEVLHNAQKNRSTERNDFQRHLSIFITDLEKLIAWAEYMEQ